MSNRNRKWIIKDSEGRVHGPFSTEKILTKIGQGELIGDEFIASFPGGDWFLISQEPEFYDRLIEVLAGSSGSGEDEEALSDFGDLEDLESAELQESSSQKRFGDEENVKRSRDSNYREKEKLNVEGEFNQNFSSHKGSKEKPKEKNRVKRQSISEDFRNENSKNKSSKSSAEKRKQKREMDSESVIELTDLGQLMRQERMRRVRLPIFLGIIAILVGVYFHLDKGERSERVHLVHLGTKKSSIPKDQLAKRIQRAQAYYSAGNFSRLLQAENELIQIIESEDRNAPMMALLCLTYFELWPYAYQDSHDLKAISIVSQKVNRVDPGGQNSATCQVVDLLARGRFLEAKNMTESILGNYGAASSPPVPFYYFKAYLLSGSKELSTAISYLNSAQQLSPGWLSPYVLEGEIHSKKGNTTEAAKIYQKILQQNPHHKVAKIKLGLIEMRDFNHLEKGTSLLKEALAASDLVPSRVFSDAFFGLAEAALLRQDKGQALAYAQRAYFYNSSNAGAKNLIVSLGGTEGLKSTLVSSQQLTFEGDQFVREGDCNAAQAHYKNAFEIDKTNALAAVKAAQCLWKLSFSREAIEWLNKAIRADPKLIDAYVLLADYFTERYDFLSAARILAQAQRESPQSYEVFRGFALIELRRGNAQGAIGYANKALALYETDVETYILLAQAYMASLDPTMAFKYAAKAVELDNNSRQGQIEFAKALAGTKGIESGLDYLLRLVNTYPLVSEYRLALGEMYLGDERFPEAIEVFHQVTQIEEKPKRAYFLLGRAQRLHGRAQDALESLLKAAILDPADTEPLFEAGLLYLEIDKPSQAKIQFQRVLRINSRHPSAHYQIGRAALMMNDPKQALKEAEEERKINPNLADAFILAAEAYYKMNQHSLCASEYTKAIKLRPQGADTYVKLARCYRLMGSFDMAENMIKTASKYNSGMPEIYRELGEIYLSKGDISLAAETFNQYFQLNPGASDRKLIERRIEDYVRGANR